MARAQHVTLSLAELSTLSRRQVCQGAGLALVSLGAPACSPAPPANRDMAGTPGSDLARAPDMRQRADLSGDLAGTCTSGFDTGSTPASIAENTAVFFAPQQVFLARDFKGLFALTSICTHMGCDVSFNEGSRKFLCPCHSSQYDQNGGVIVGPASSDLAHYALCLSGGGTVIIDSTEVVASAMRYAL